MLLVFINACLPTVLIICRYILDRKLKQFVNFFLGDSEKIFISLDRWFHSLPWVIRFFAPYPSYLCGCILDFQLDEAGEQTFLRLNPTGQFLHILGVLAPYFWERIFTRIWNDIPEILLLICRLFWSLLVNRSKYSAIMKLLRRGKLKLLLKLFARNYHNPR